MINELVLVGRLATNPKAKVVNGGYKVCNFLLAVDRAFKNEDSDSVVTDFINVSVWQGFADAVAENCRKGAIIGLKGRLSSKIREIGGIKVNQLEVFAERVVFIHLIGLEESKKVEEELHLNDLECDLE